MGSIITIASSKGGSGKTTLAILLSSGLVARDYRVAVIDADSNATLSDWIAANYEGPSLTSIAETDHVAVIARAQDAADTHDVVICDTAGFSNLTAASAIGAADAVLIPCMADRGSVRETMRTVRQVHALAAAARRAIPCRVVLSQWTARGLAEQAARADLEADKSPLLDTEIPQISAFRQATFTGVLPGSGRTGDIAHRIIRELARIGFIPKKGK